jgi:dTMP kinase
VVATREPTDGPWGRRIREMARSGETVAPEQELRWFVEDRREHVARVIAPGLDAGKLVLTDRYFLSTVAYQGARGLDWRAILADAEAEFPVPDLALLFEIDPAVGLARARGRPGAAEPSFEDGDFLARVAAVYAAVERPWLVRLDAARDAGAVLAAAVEATRTALG